MGRRKREEGWEGGWERGREGGERKDGKEYDLPSSRLNASNRGTFRAGEGTGRGGGAWERGKGEIEERRKDRIVMIRGKKKEEISKGGKYNEGAERQEKEEKEGEENKR